MKKILVLLLCFMLTGCAISSRITKLKVGMAKEDIIKKYGKPNSIRVLQGPISEVIEQGEEAEILTYEERLYDTPIGQMGFKPSAKHTTVIYLKDGRVVKHYKKLYAPKMYRPSTYEPDPKTQGKEFMAALPQVLQGVAAAMRGQPSPLPQVPQYQPVQTQQQPIQTYQPVTTSQRTFADGYQDGYKEGYIYNPNSIDRITPIRPITPIRYIGENTYEDGYRRGIIEGQRAAQRK